MMRMRWDLFLIGACLAGGGAWSAELVRLTEDTYAEYAPLGREVDAIHGDFVLRNDRLVAVIADADPRRRANMMTLGIAGGVLDLTVRDRQSDQLTAYLPWLPFMTVFPEELEVDGTPAPIHDAEGKVLRGARWVSASR